jgi:predicted RNA-binding protein with TRAM domain
MQIPEQLQTLFSALIEERSESYVVEVPKDELNLGQISLGETYRVALLPSPTAGASDPESSEPERDHTPQTPPVEEGETRDVEIDDIGDQGDGIARVERGFVIVVPDTELGERVTIEITTVRDNVAFADVVERLSYFE